MYWTLAARRTVIVLQDHSMLVSQIYNILYYIYILYTHIVYKSNSLSLCTYIYIYIHTSIHNIIHAMQFISSFACPLPRIRCATWPGFLARVRPVIPPCTLRREGKGAARGKGAAPSEGAAGAARSAGAIAPSPFAGSAPGSAGAAGGAAADSTAPSPSSYAAGAAGTGRVGGGAVAGDDGGRTQAAAQHPCILHYMIVNYIILYIPLYI